MYMYVWSKGIESKSKQLNMFDLTKQPLNCGGSDRLSILSHPPERMIMPGVEHNMFNHQLRIERAKEMDKHLKEPRIWFAETKIGPDATQE